MRKPSHLLLGLLLGLSACVHADVRLPHVFGDHMVLQRDRAVPVWGWAEPGETVAVQAGRGEPVTTTAGADGNWRVNLPAMPAGGPLTLTVRGNNTVTFSDVLVGEVWVASGQSNMQWSVAASLNPAEEIAAATDSKIREFAVPRVPQPWPVEDIDAAWQVASPGTVGNFSAAAYFMARELRRQLGVPVGILHTSWGGTRIEPWIPPVGFNREPELSPMLAEVLLTHPTSELYRNRQRRHIEATEAWVAEAKQALEERRPVAPSPAYPPELLPLTDDPNPMQQPTTLYNGMVHPLIPYAIRGAIWYQGESNHGEGAAYTTKMRALIGGWRELWQQGEFPFYYVQIAPWEYGGEPSHILPVFWEAQAAALAVPNTGMVITNDIGDIQDIHPKNKQEVGRRLALLALRHTYGREDVVAEGPTFREMIQEPGRLRVVFDHAEGLHSRDGGPLTWFEITGEDTDWTPAEARIDGNSVVLSSPEVAQPVAMRFAWHRIAEPNLANAAGLPAGAFRAGEEPVRDYLAIHVDEAADYRLVYDLDLANLSAQPTYTIDNHAAVGDFDRVGYFLELQRDREPVQWVWVSMDAFTDDAAKLGIPTVASGAVFQQRVADLNVQSNAPGIVTGTGLDSGNIEFWPHNYGPGNSAGIPNASPSLWDFGDDYGEPVEGYGSMQVHNHAAQQTIFAINAWRTGGGADLGIGNSSSDPRTRDWTFSGNAGEYTLKRLRVLVRER